MGADSHRPWVCPANQPVGGGGGPSTGGHQLAATPATAESSGAKRAASSRQRKLATGAVDDLAAPSSRSSPLIHGRHRYRSTTALAEPAGGQLSLHHHHHHHHHHPRQYQQHQHQHQVLGSNDEAAPGSRQQQQQPLPAPGATMPFMRGHSAAAAAGELGCDAAADSAPPNAAGPVVLSLHNSQHLASGYSSGSQAHLQSLVSPAGAGGLWRATSAAEFPVARNKRGPSPPPNFAGNFGAALNEPSSQQRPHRAATGAQQVRQRCATLGARIPVPPTEPSSSGAAASVAAAKLLPPPYSLVMGAEAVTQTPPPQPPPPPPPPPAHVICQQPSAASYQPMGAAPAANQASLAHLAAARQSNGPSSSARPPTAPSQQLLLNANLSLRQPHHYLPPNYHHHHHQHPRQMPAPATCLNGGGGGGAGSAGAFEATCRANSQYLQQQANTSQAGLLLRAPSKSRAWLTCADISIKWYIVVIALLGLMCALVGTIVGAVHSAGRDYISLALLLVGVGLVLVSISWIALRITVKTYQASRLAGRPNHLNHNHLHYHHRLTTPVIRPAHVGRLLTPAAAAAAAASSLPATSSASLQRNLVNERLYIMAAAAALSAAAAAAATTTNPPRPPVSGAPDTPAESASEGAQAPGSALLATLRRSVSRLIRYTHLTRGGSAASPEAGGHQQRARLVAADASALDPAHLAALLHHHYHNQYSGQQHGPAMGFLLGPAAGHQLAQQQLASLLDDPCLRPPPPSYSASMQDNRMRRILQERAGLQQVLLAQQQQSAAPSAASPQPAPASSSSSRSQHPPPPAPFSNGGSSASWNLHQQTAAPPKQPGSGTRVHDLKETTGGGPAPVSVANDIYEAAAPELRQSSLGRQTPPPTQHHQTRSKSQVKILGYV